MTDDSRRPRPSFTAIAAVLALVLAVGGTAFAAPDIARKLDGKERKQIRKIAKREADKRIDARATGLSVSRADTAGVADTAAVATAIAPGAVDAGSVGTLRQRTVTVNIPNNDGDAGTVDCAAGEVMISGGASTAGVGASAGWTLIRSGPEANGWSAAAHNETGGAASLIVEVICLEP